jgi:unsaturated rhamnogalacturonyl hydrolase
MSGTLFHHVSGRIVAIFLFVQLLFCAASGCAQTQVRSTLPWSERMAMSEMARLGDSIANSVGPNAKWRYETGLFLSGLERIWKNTAKKEYLRYIKKVVDSYIGPDGSIATYKADDYNLDNINSGKVVLALYEETEDPKYRAAATRLMEQLGTQPRTSEGGFWHKKIYPHQMWLDGIYMASPFYAQYCRTFGRPAGFDDVPGR